MRRTDLVRHLESHGCELLREGKRHSVYIHRANQRTSTVPRDREIKPFTARAICRQLVIPEPE